jgi:hypothetical protein
MKSFATKRASRRNVRHFVFFVSLCGESFEFDINRWPGMKSFCHKKSLKSQSARFASFVVANHLTESA